MPALELEGESNDQGRVRSPTGSDSMVSTASSSSEDLSLATTMRRKDWVHFEVEAESKPPLPPPRSQLDDFGSREGAVLANPAVTSGTESENLVDFNATSMSSGRVSPFEDFSAQVAETLFSQSRNRTSIDAYTADLMATASRDIYKAIGPTIPESTRESEVSLPEPLFPTSSSNSVSSLDSNTCTGTFLSTNPFVSLPLKSTTNGFRSSPGHPALQKGLVRPQGPPPLKPQPYSGNTLSVLQKQSGSDDPFSNLLGGISMQAYANTSAKCSSPAADQTPVSTEKTRPTAVESPLV